MPSSSDIARGNEIIDSVLYLSGVTYPTLGANASGSNTFIVPGLQPLDLISWNMQSPPAHLVLDNIYVSAINTLTILWSTDATGISTGTVPVLIEVVRPSNANLGSSALPSALV